MTYGFLGHIGIGRETTAWGSAQAATDHFKALSESLSTEIDRYETINIHAAMHEPDDSAGMGRHEGDVVFAAHPIGIGYFLMGAMGHNSASFAESSSVLVVNEFTMATVDAGSLSALPAYTLEIFRDVTSSHRYVGCQFNTLELNVAPNQDVRCSVGIISKTQDIIQKTGATFPGSPVEAFTFDSTSIDIAGSATAKVEALTINIDNLLEGIPTLNSSTDVYRIQRSGMQTVRLSGTIAFDDITEYQKFKNQTEQSFTAYWTKANSFSMKVEIPRMIYNAFPVGIGGRDRQTVEFAGMARYHTGSATALKITLTTIKSFG